MNKYFHNLVLGVSVLPALLIVPASATGYTWAHPDDVQSFETIDHGINFVLNKDNENAGAGIITGTAMRNTVNGDVVLTLDGVTQNNEGIETNVYGSLFLPSTGGLLSVATLTGVQPTAEQSLLQQYIDGNVTVNILSNSEIAKSVVGVNFYTSPNGITRSGLSGKTTVNVVNSTVNESVRGTNFREATEGITGIEIGDVELNIKDSLIKEEIVAAGSHASAKNVVINIEGNSVIGYTALDSNTKKGDGQVLAGANRKGASVDSTVINLNTDGTIRIAGNVHTGSRYRGDSNEPALGSVRGNATLNMFGGGNVEIGGDVRAYRVAGDTTLNLKNITANVAGEVKEFETINIDALSELRAGTLTMTADDVLNIAITDADTYGKVIVDTLDVNGAKLNMTFKGEGTYNLISATNTTGDFFTWAENKVYDIANDSGTFTVKIKSVEDIAESTGLKGETAVAVSHVAEAASKSDSVLLQDLSLKMQEKLAENTPEAKAAVEHATKAIHPEKESVAQSVSTSVQNTVVNLASARMSAPSVGRSGGDVEFTKGGVWAQGLFNKSKQADAFNGYTRGIALGLDGTINKDWTIGAGYSYAHSDINGTARDTEIDSNTIFLYGQYKPAQWYVNAIANYTMSDYSERGTVLDGAVVTGDYDVDSFGGALATGYDFANGITPELGLRYMHVNANDYANSYGINTHIDDTDFLTGVIGAKYAFNVVATRHLTFVPQLNAGVKYDLLSDKNTATVAMPGVNAYTIDGNRLKRIGGEFGIGLGMQYRELNVSVNYDIDVREDYASQTGMLKFRYNF